MIKTGNRDPDQIESELHQSDIKTSPGNNCKPTDNISLQA